MNENRADQYQSAYLNDYGFESVMVHYRRELLLERLDELRPEVVIEIGCGSELLYDAWAKRGARAKCWVVVEPAEHFAEIARSSKLENLHVVQDFFEKAVLSVLRHLTRTPDLVICSSLLHEVPSAEDLVRAVGEVMGEDSLLHVNVPNAESMHRRLAKTMEIISDTKEMSNRNKKLLQNRVFDMGSLKEALTSEGYVIRAEGGYMIKPFTHGQMEQIYPILGKQVLDGLYRLGMELPDLASEIYVEVRKVANG